MIFGRRRGTDGRKQDGLFRRAPDLRRLWAAGAISQLGTRVSLLATPLLALTVLHATVFQLSLLNTVKTLPSLLIGLQVGVWCDRMRRKPVLLVADLGRALVFASVPVAALFGVLGMTQLDVVVFVAGVLTVFFDVAQQSYLPTLVGREDLLVGNARMQMNQSVAATAGPTVGGWLVQLLSAPVAVLADALSYLWSAAWVWSVRAEEARPVRGAETRLWRDVGDGLRFVFGQPVMRALTLSATTVCLFQSVYNVVIMPFLVDDLRLSAGLIGTLSGAAMAFAVLAALTTDRITRKIGTGSAIRWAGMATGIGALIIPLTGPGWRLGLYVVGNGLLGFSIILWVVVEASYCQSVCPPELLGRMNATMRFLMWGVMPIGSLLAGGLGTALGNRTTLVIAGAGMAAALGWLICSPVRTARQLPYEA